MIAAPGRRWIAAATVFSALVAAGCGGSESSTPSSEAPTTDVTDSVVVEPTDSVDAGTDTTDPESTEPESTEPVATDGTDTTDPAGSETDAGPIELGPATDACPGGVALSGVSDATPEVAEVNVAALPLVDFAPLFYAAECGFFDAEGLTVSLEIVQGGPVAGQLLTSGDVQFSFNNWLSVVATVANGAPLKVVANGTSLDDGQGAIFVKADSDITEPADLVGATLAVNSTGTVGDITTASRLAELGIEGLPNWVPTPFPDTIPAIESGAVDGGMLTEPFTSQARAMGLREVLDLYTGATQNLPISGYVSVAPFVDANPQTTAAFRAAIEQATTALAADEAALRAFIPLYSPVPEQAAQGLILPIYRTELTVDDLQRPADLMAELGFLDKPLDMTPFVWEPAS